MKAGDISKAIFIIVIFFVLYISNILLIGLKRIKKEWPLYRCNPIIMPFAGLMGHDATENFTYCIQNMQTNFMGYLLQPLHYNFNLVGDITSHITNAINDVRKFFYKLRTFIGNIIENVFGVFLNVIVEFQRITINIRDIFGKLAGMLVVMIYTIGGSMMTAQSWIDGVPGKMLRTASNFCFAADTLVKLKNGEIYKMSEIPLGSILSNGAIVRSVMAISNKENDTYLDNIYYVIDGGVNNTKIYVTGCHLVFDVDKRKYVHVKKLPGSRISKRPPDEKLACLITSNHTIPIGDVLFHDWDDNQSTVLYLT